MDPKARYREKNRELLRKQSCEYRKVNAEKVRAYSRVRPSELLEKARQKWKAANPVQHKESQRAWSRRNRAYANAQLAKYRAAKLQATPAWAHKVAIEEMYAFAAIKTKLTGQQWEVDHIIPLRGKMVCGLHTHTNLQVILAVDNRRKGNRLSARQE